MNSAGHLETMWQTSPNGSWSSWQDWGVGPNGGFAPGTQIGVGISQAGEQEIFAVTTTGHLETKWQTSPNGSWSNWAEFGSGGFTPGANVGVGVSAEAEMEIFVVNSAGVLQTMWQTSPNGSWSPWATFATGYTPGMAIGVGVSAAKEMEIYLVNAAGVLQTMWQTTPNGSWSSLATFATGYAPGTPIGAGISAAKEMEIYVVDGKGNLQTMWQTSPNGSWSSWLNWGPPAGNTACGATAPGPVTKLSAAAVSASEIDLAWTAPSAGASVASVEICREATSAAVTSACAGGTKLSAAGTATSYKDTGLNASTTYYYTVFDLDSTGTLPSTGAVASATTSASALPAPTVTAVSPASGPLAGGTTVTITGTNFTGATGVKFGSAAGTNLTVVSASSVTVTAPAGTAGSVDVTVTTPSGTSTTNPGDKYTYVAVAPTPPDIHGVVTSAVTGKPIAGVVVTTGSNPTLTATTDSTGTYVFNHLNPGYYQLCFNAAGVAGAPAGGYVNVCQTNNGGVSVGAATDATENQALAVGGTVSGTITSAKDGSGVGGVKVWIYDGTTGSFATAYSQTPTTSASNGTYTISGIAPSTSPFTVCFDASSATPGTSATGYQSQCYKNVPWDRSQQSVSGKIAPVSVTAGGSTPNISASLAAGGEITGKVSAGANGVGGVKVWVFNDSSGELATSYGTTTSSAGTYTVPNLSSSVSYDVCFDASAATGTLPAGGYQSQCYSQTPWTPNTPLPTGVKPLTPQAGVATPNINASLSSGGAISGKVSSSGGVGIAGVTVDIFDPNSYNQVGTATTNSSGAYTVAGLTPSSYYVCFDTSTVTTSPGYLDQCYKGVAWDGQPYNISGSASTVTTTAGTTQPVNATLASTGAVSGKVTAGTNGPGLGSVTVLVFPTGSNPNNATTATTDSTGAYTVNGLAAGTYEVCFDAANAAGGSSATGYADQCYSNVAWNGGYSVAASGAKSVTVTAGNTASAINAVLTPGGSISGKVMTASGSNPLNYVDVEVINPANGDVVGSGTTDSTGAYTVSGLLAGNYDVCFDASQATGGSSLVGYSDRCYTTAAWDGYSTPSGATAVKVAASQTTTGINVQLVAAPGISGTVTDASGNPLSGVLVEIDDTNGNYAATARTNASGVYATSVPQPGSYDVCFDASLATGGSSTNGYVSQCYKDVSWNPNLGQPSTGLTTVTTTLGQTSTGISASLAAGATLTGTVRDASSNGVQSVNVDVINPTTGAEVGYANTSSTGTYTVTGLPAGSYDVCFDASNASGGSSSNGYADQCSTNIAWGGNTSNVPSGVTPVSLTAGSTSTANATLASLAASSTISGTVTATGGAQLGGVKVIAFDQYGNQVGSLVTDSTGTYSLAGLAPSSGGYQVCFDPSQMGVTPSVGSVPANGYAGQCYNDVAWNENAYGDNAPATKATVVMTTSSAATKSGVNATLVNGGTISGTVTDASGAGLTNAIVTVIDSSTGQPLFDESTGSAYTISGLAAGTYDVCFDFSNATPAAGSAPVTGYLDQCYKNVAWNSNSTYSHSPVAPTGATPVTLTAGQARSGVDAVAATGGAVTGTVTMSTSVANAGVVIEAIDPSSGTVVAQLSQETQGSYTLKGLPAGNYDVCFAVSSEAYDYTGQCYNGVAWTSGSPVPSGTNAVAVAGGSTTGGVNATLALSPSASTIAGTVTDAAGHGLAGVTVDLFESPTNLVAQYTTTSNGSYSIAGLNSNDTFEVCFDAASATGGTSASGYMDQCYQDVPWSGMQLGNPTEASPSATPISLTPGQITSGIGAALATGSAISGTVTGPTGGPAPYASVEVFAAGGGSPWQTTASSSGTYTLTGLPAGSYDVCFVPYESSGPGSQCYNNVAWDGNSSDIPSGATLVTTKTGTTTTGINNKFTS